MASTLLVGQSEPPPEQSAIPSVRPPPMADQLTPSHLAMQLTLVNPPAVVNSPPTNSSVPLPANVCTIPLTPALTFVQVVPVHWARYLMLELFAALVKSPPT